MRLRLFLVFAGAALLAFPGWAGEGAVALQTADTSCRTTKNPPPRYVNCGNGTVTDNKTGLVWLANADCYGQLNWHEAMDAVAGLADIPSDSYAWVNDCGLSDGSSPGEWRLPTVAELEAMMADAMGADGDPNCTLTPPILTNDSGLGCWVSGPSSFLEVNPGAYWSSTTRLGYLSRAYAADLEFGGVGAGPDGCKTDCRFYVWPVRGGQ